MFELNIPRKLENDSLNGFYMGKVIESIEGNHFPRSKVKTTFDIKKNRIIVRYPSKVSTLQNRVLKTAIAFSKKMDCEILVGIADKNKNLSVIMNVSVIGFRKYEIRVKDRNGKLMLNKTYTLKKQMIDDLSKIAI